MKDTTGLSLGYRLLWRLEYAGVTVFGPPTGTSHTCPKRRLRRERATRVDEAHKARGTETPQEVLDIIASGGDKPKKPKRVASAA